MIPAILVILTIHISVAVCRMLIKILSVVINDWERIKAIAPGGCYLDMIIHKNRRILKTKQTFLQPVFPQYYIERLHGRLHRECRYTENIRT